MPRPSVYLSPNVRVSVKPHFLQRTGVLEALELTEDGKRKFWVTLDLLPVQSFAFDATCIRYEGPRNNNQQGQALEEQTDAMEVKDEDQQPAVDEEEKVDLFLEAGEQTTDARMARPDDAFYGRCSVRVARGSSLARYFLAFLPIQHLDSVVIPAINMHAVTLITNWCPVTLPEYLIWVALFVIMSTMIIPDKKAYWRKSDFAFDPNVDFSMYMTDYGTLRGHKQDAYPRDTQS
ncbi:hypothetical protein V8B55DRAFT_1560543 [Mucor lusitanicus]|uniref:PiggyBac transposable element-derived protein domain-containing protein n=1 Tax=Mucor lusitanicus CBS 277.49 TaxID=747725 RepID=A0A162R2M9_MUCCL|nr:hypothetical protein MUCCIDRAFT_104671 [Mucor lusitanicus CBS 277.49]